MKRIIQVLLMSLLLFSCTSSKDPLDKMPKTKKYLDAMDSYEFMEVALLGNIYVEDGVDLEFILNRAKDKMGLDFIDEIDKDHIIYGKQSLRSNYVYLFIPAKGMDLEVGSYNSDTDDISEVFYKAKSSLPFIYIESGEAMNPVGIVKYGSEESDYYDGRIFTGLDIMNSEIRSSFRMGLVDISDYNMFTSSEIPSYGQFIFDMAHSLSNANYEKQISFMDEAMIDGEMYLVFIVIDDDSAIQLHAINYSSEKNEIKYLVSYDGNTFVKPDEAKG